VGFKYKKNAVKYMPGGDAKTPERMAFEKGKPQTVVKNVRKPVGTTDGITLQIGMEEGDVDEFTRN